MKTRYLLCGLAIVFLLTTNGCGAGRETMAGRQPAGESVTVEAGGFYEACDQWAVGKRVRYSFTADSSLDFNIHYHAEHGKVYPVKKAGIGELSGEFEVKSGAIHCCMWTNAHDRDVALRYVFKERGESE